MSKSIAIAKQTEVVELTDPNSIMQFANNIKTLILDNKLYTTISGKKYINVEGWQIAGAFTGVFPVVEKVEQVSAKTGEYKYRAEVSLRDKDGNQVGYGVALCSNLEPGKKGFAEYAVASMAQTRAVGKAFRMKIGWLLKVAGYETTPAEEMDVVAKAQEAQTVESAPEPAPKKGPSIRERSYAIDRMERCKSMEELKSLWNSFDYDMTHEPEVIEKKNELKNKFAEAMESGV